MSSRNSGLFAPPLSDDPKELTAALARTSERFTNVLGVCRTIGSTLDLDEVLDQVIAKTSKALRAERSTLFLVDREKAEIWSKVVQGEGVQEIRLPLGSGIAGWVAAHDEPVLLNDAAADERFNRAVDRVTGYRTRSMVVVPLHDRKGGVLGSIQALNRIDGEFSQTDLAVLEAIAAQAGVAIENARLYENVLAQNAELDLLYDIERLISTAHDVEELVDGILAKAIEVLDVEAGSVLALDEEKGALKFLSASGPTAEQVKKLEIRLGEGIAGRVVESGDSVIANEASKHPLFAPRVPRQLGVTVRSLLCVPLSADDTVLGALELLNPSKGRDFDDDDLRLATVIAGQIARAIGVARARVEGERKARLASIGQMISGILHDLRTPMTLVSGYAQLMVPEAELAERERSAEIILKQLDHMSAMAKETLAFARGETDILLRKVYLNKLVEELTEFLTKDFDGKKIELKVVGNFLGTVRMDEGKIKRALYNIARNAAQAMPEGGKFTLTVDKEDDFVVFRMADTGPGIPDEIADKLFQSFVTSGKKDGTGLGLAIVKKVAEQHKGDVSFKSKPGKGTTFTLRIPA